jgi:hypothetical protein
MHLLKCVPHIAVSVRKGGLDPVLKEQLYNCMETIATLQRRQITDSTLDLEYTDRHTNSFLRYVYQQYNDRS